MKKTKIDKQISKKSTQEDESIKYFIFNLFNMNNIFEDENIICSEDKLWKCMYWILD